MGYGIPMAALEKLVRNVYHDDPAERFPCQGRGIRDPLTMSRMQKAMAVIQFKLESQTIRRNPDFQPRPPFAPQRKSIAEHGTLALDGVVYPLADWNLPTVDWSDPSKLSPQEEECMAQFKISFLQSQTLWEQMHYLERKGAMHLVRDYNLIFHGCVPVDEAGEFLPMRVGGVEYRGRALVRRARCRCAPGVPRQGPGLPRPAVVSVVRAAVAAVRQGQDRHVRELFHRGQSRRTRKRRTRISSSSTRNRFAGASWRISAWTKHMASSSTATSR